LLVSGEVALMALILAVEPDPLRLAHFTSLTRGRPRTDLLIAESVRAALSAITTRVPAASAADRPVNPGANRKPGSERMGVMS